MYKPENQERINQLYIKGVVTMKEGDFLLNIMEKPELLTTKDLNIIKDRFKTYIRLSEKDKNKKVLYCGILGIINKIIAHREEFKQYIKIQRAEINKIEE